MLRSSLFVLVLLASLAGTAQADCPQACITLGANAPICTSASSYSRFQSGDCYELANFHVPDAQLQAEAFSGGTPCSTDLTLPEDFTLQGIPDGTVLTIIAQLQATAGGATGGHATVKFSSDAQQSSWDLSDFGASGARDTLLTIPVQATAGSPFRLTFEITASAEGVASAFGGGTFSFDGLPPSGSIVSCRGYVLPAQRPVAAKPASWGNLKARYR